MSSSTWRHLRFGLSFYLFPVFAFALSQTPSYAPGRALLVFLILHLLVYPASNGFNSYYDRDQESIGGLEKPPPVTRDLLVVSLTLDALALVLATFIGARFAAMLLIFGSMSKAYSHPAIRLKGSSWGGWLTVAVFQGAFTYLMVVTGISGPGLQPSLHSMQVMAPALLSSLLFGGAYPMTQVYQHAEDKRRGDRTLSVALGVRGTFLFSGALFGLSVPGFFLFFDHTGRRPHFYLLLVFLLPIAFYFANWLARVLRDETSADFRSSMALSTVSSACLSCFFLVLALC